jgi:vitamin K-dependent gamma-carboxylase
MGSEAGLGRGSRSTFWARVSSLAQSPVDIASLAAFRFLFGLTLALSACRFIAYGWVERLFLSPSFRFKYYGFEWVEPLPAEWMHGVFYGLVGLGILVAVGAFYRVTAVLLALGFTYFQLIDASNYLNHYYLAALLAWLLACLPAARSFSVDAWLRARRGRPAEPETVSRLVLWLLRAQIAIVYFFAGIAKAQPDWLVHAQPLRIWLSARADLPLLGPLFRIEGVALLMSWAGFLFDTTIVAFLLWRKTRPLAFLAVVVFHVLTRLLFPIGMFPTIMVLSVLVFFEPSWPREFAERALTLLSKAGAQGRRAAARLGAAASWRPELLPSSRAPRRGWIVLGLFYLALQMALPLRAFAYPGNVLWHEQGMRFSFRVMLRAKGGVTTFRVLSEEREKPFYVSPSRYLNGFQESEMSGQPDLILQLARHIRSDFERHGYHGVRVYADSRVALNGRRSAPFLDPNVDLSQVRDGLAPVAYVLPAPRGPAPATLPTF